MKNKLLYSLIIIITLALITSISLLSVLSLDTNVISESTEKSTNDTTAHIADQKNPQITQTDSTTSLEPIHLSRDSIYERSAYSKNDIAQNKSFIQNNSAISLTYSKSEIYESGKHVDVYVNSNGDEYSFNQAGEILSIDVSDETFLSGVGNYVGDNPTTTDLTEDIAIKIATQAARSQFGNRFNLLEFDSVRRDDTSKCFYVYFYQKIGDNKFINGIYAYVTIFPNGTVGNCCMENYDDLIDFDQSLLETLSEDSILYDINTQVESLYEEDLSNYTILGIQLKNDNGAYYVEVKTKSSFDSGFSFVDIFRYDLSEQNDDLSIK